MQSKLEIMADRQKRLFFDVTAIPNQSSPDQKSSQERREGWAALFQSVGVKTNDIAAFGDGTVNVIFQDGLVMEDKGNKVSFLANGDKESVKSEAVLPAIRCIANHLMRRGWNNMSWDIGTNAAGSTEMIQAFSKAAKEATNMLFWEKHGKDHPKHPAR